MATYPNIIPAVNDAGILYANGFALPGAEGDLFNGAGFDPIPTQYFQAISAEVTLTAQGNFATNTSYVVMQTDFGDGNWVDVAWCTWTGLSKSVTFQLSAVVSVTNAIQQTRAAGTAPTPSIGNSNVSLGSRVRFVGKATTSSGSSSSSASPGQATGILATIRYKQLGLR